MTIFFSSTEIPPVSGLLGVSILVFSVIFFLWIVSGLADSRLAKSSATYSTRTTPPPPPIYRLHPQPLLALPLYPPHPLHQPSNLAYQPVKIPDSSNNLRFESSGSYHTVFPEAWGLLLTHSFLSDYVIPSGIRQEEMARKMRTLICQMDHHYSLS